MNYFSKVALLSICTSLTSVAPVMANEETAAIMQELFDVYYSSIGTPEVGSVDDAGRSTRWNDVTVKGDEDGVEAKLAWIEVSKKLLGGYSVAMAEEFTISGGLPDGDGELSGTFTSEGFEMEVSGSAGARVYDMTVSQIRGEMTAGDLFEMEMQMNAVSAQSTVANEIMTGTFDYPKFDLQYKVSVEGQSSDIVMSMVDMKGKYRAPVLGGQELKHYKKLWNPDEEFFADYTISGIETKMEMMSPAGPVSVNTTGGATVGRMAATNGVVSMGGQASDVVYKVSAMGMPPMNVTMDQISSGLAIPLDNVDDVKKASIQVAMTGLELDTMIWAMFDPQGKLPKDKANLEIDLSAGVKWAQKMEAFDVTQLATGLPVQFEDVKINALNLDALGAELKTDGTFDINTAKFPPEASGVANVSVKGVNDLMGKLTQAGLLPVQNALMAKGMMGMFFKQGGDGLDHLTSQIMVAPNGSITANGIPLK
jgi:hypothetical protein